MTVANLHNDVLTDDELATVTGIQKGSWHCQEKRVSVLRAAGIYFWLDGQQGIVTTWTHVHRAGQDQAPNQPKQKPDFARVK